MLNSTHRNPYIVILMDRKEKHTEENYSISWRYTVLFSSQINAIWHEHCNSLHPSENVKGQFSWKANHFGNITKMKSSMLLGLLVRSMENVFYLAAFIQRPKEFTTKYFAICITGSSPCSSPLYYLLSTVYLFCCSTPCYRMKTNNSSLASSLPFFLSPIPFKVY